MIQETIKTFINEIYSEGPKQNNATNKTDVYHIDDVWSLVILDLKGYGPENYRGHRYVLVIIGNFSKSGRTIPRKDKNAMTIKDSLEIIIINSKRKPGLIETDLCDEFYYIIFQDFLKKYQNLFKKQFIWCCFCRTL